MISTAVIGGRTAPDDVPMRASYARRVPAPGHDYASPMATSGKPKRNWIQEERRKTLGDWVAFCIGCGFTLRYFVELESRDPGDVPELRERGAPPLPGLRRSVPVGVPRRVRGVRGAGATAELFGGPIRKAGK